MYYVWWLAGLMLGIFWLDRLQDALRGMRSLADITVGHAIRLPLTGTPLPRVTVVVPARNEEAKVEAGVGSLLHLDYPDFEVIALDDRSTDRTGEILDRLARHHRAAALRVIHVRDLPSGWLGKPHAMWLGAQQGTGEWILFTDADVIFRADTLRRAVAYAEQSRADHLVLLASNVTESFGEKLMLAGFRLLFVFGHRPWKVADPKAADFIGLGPFNFVRRDVYERIGTACALRMEVVEDMKLGKLVKQHGFASRIVFGPGLLTWHWGRGAFGLVHNLGKNFYAVMEYRWWKAVGGCLALLALNVGPFAGVLFAPGWTRLGFGIALGCIAGLFLGLTRRARISPFFFLLLPASSALLIYTMLRSMFLTLWHGGVVWRGTHYSLDELRKGLV